MRLVDCWEIQPIAMAIDHYIYILASVLWDILSKEFDYNICIKENKERIKVQSSLAKAVVLMGSNTSNKYYKIIIRCLYLDNC